MCYLSVCPAPPKIADLASGILPFQLLSCSLHSSWLWPVILFGWKILRNFSLAWLYSILSCLLLGVHILIWPQIRGASSPAVPSVMIWYDIYLLQLDFHPVETVGLRSENLYKKRKRTAIWERRNNTKAHNTQEGKQKNIKRKLNNISQVIAGPSGCVL